MATRQDIVYFKLKPPGEGTWIIPVAPIEGSDSLNFTSSWSTVNVQGGTEAISAFNYTNNPTIPINLKFHEDLWRECNITSHTYEETIAKFASLQYPRDSGSKILAPYLIIEFNGFIFRGYFTSLRITQTGPLRVGSSNKVYRPICEISGQFTIVKSSSPIRSEISKSFKTYFGS